MYLYIHTYIYIHTHIHLHIQIQTEIRLDDTKTAPYCSFINSKAKKLTKIH